MAITVDVITRVTEQSLRGSSRQINQTFGQAGKNAGETFAREYGKQLDKVSDKLGQIKVTEQKIQEIQAKGVSASSLIAQQEKLNKLKREQRRLTEEAADSYRRFTTDATNGLDVMNRSATGVLRAVSNLSAGTRFGSLTAGIADVASGATAAGMAVEGFGASMLAASTIAATTVVAAFVAVGAAATSLTKQLYDLGSEWDDTFDNIIIKTGASGDVLQQIKESVKDVAGEVPASLGAIGDVAAQVAQNLKLVGPGADDIIRSLGVLKSKGFEVNIHDLGMAFRALDVDQSDYQGTLEQFLGLAQRTGVSIDSVTSAITDNAGALKEFGFTAGEVVTLMDMFDKAGIDPDKGIGSLGKAFKALTDAGLEPTKDNLQLVFDEINRFVASGQIDRANDELNKLFGARGGGLAWADLIKEGKLNLDELATAAEAPRSSIDDMAASTDDFKETWQMAMNDAKTALEPLSSGLFTIVNESLKGFSDWIKENKPEIIGFFTGVSTQVVNLVEVLTGMLGTALTDIGKILPDFLGGDKFESAGQDLMDLSAKLDYMQGKLQEAGDKANDAAEEQRKLGEGTLLAAEATDDLADALERAASAPPVPFSPGAILGQGGPTAGANPFNPGGILGPGITGPQTPVRGTPGRGFPLPWMLPALDSALISNVPAGRYSQTGAADLTQGLADCSSAVEDLVNLMDGMPTGGRSMSTHNADEWLTSRGFLPGYMPGAFNVGFSDSHMQATLPGGTPFNWGSDAAAAAGGVGGTGALDPSFTKHYYRPVGTSMMAFGPGGAPLDGPLPPGTPSPIPGLQPGPVGSTFGYNEYGEPGYYRPDSDSIRSAERSKNRADKSVQDAQERLGELQKDIADLEAQRTVLNSKKTDEDIANKQKQIADLQEQIADLKDNAAEADRRLADAQRGRFTGAREARASSGTRGGGLGQVGAPLADDMGLSEGLPGLAKFAATALANMAFAPMIGALSAVSAANPIQGGYGLMGMMGAQNIAAGGSPLGLALPPGPVSPDPSIGPAPIGGGVGAPMGVPHAGTGAAPGPTSFAPSAGPGGGGFQGLGGMPMQAITQGLALAGPALDAIAPGAGQAAQIGVQLANRTAAYIGQVAGIGVGGLMETFLPHGSPLADPNKSWVGRIAAGFAGARPALPNTSGGDPGMNPAGQPAKPQTPEEAQALQAQNGGGQANGPMVQVGAINNYTPDGGQSLANQIGRMQLSQYASGGKR